MSPGSKWWCTLYRVFHSCDLVDVVLLPDCLARTSTSPSEAQACRIWIVTVKAKILPGTVRKLTQDCAVITPVLQSAHVIATPTDVHEVLHTQTMCKNTKRLTMLVSVTIGFACAGKSYPDHCGQVVAH